MRFLYRFRFFTSKFKKYDCLTNDKWSKYILKIIYVILSDGPMLIHHFFYYWCFFNYLYSFIKKITFTFLNYIELKML